MKILGQLLVLHDFGDFTLFFKNPKIMHDFEILGSFCDFKKLGGHFAILQPYLTRI